MDDVKGIYTRKPSRGNGRKAWEQFEIDYGRAPYSVSYSPNYHFQHKGWICEFCSPGELLPICLERETHKFYFSQDL